jgi:hypothetical protein
MTMKYIFLLILALLLVGTVSATNVTPIPTTTYQTKYLDPFMNVSWDFSKQAPILVSVYGDMFGNTTTNTYGNTMIIGAWFLMIVGLIWLRSESIVVPMMMVVLLGNIVLFAPGMAPDEWKNWIVLLLFGVPVGCIFYTFIKGRT